MALPGPGNHGGGMQEKWSQEQGARMQPRCCSLGSNTLTRAHPQGESSLPVIMRKGDAQEGMGGRQDQVNTHRHLLPMSLRKVSTIFLLYLEKGAVKKPHPCHDVG